MLQWSHVFSDMVRILYEITQHLTENASMEPCLFRHGKIRMSPGGAVARNSRLQWSHVFSDMVRAHLYMRTLKADKRCHKNVVTVPGY
ncbi:protein of unknown function [Methanoculleus bourgensis]|uniref:Uncharacterized protein n=1 Tax=Methanoculleus bourgensis TaxID=83986 RepID=A0A0X8XY52_9EURY|nr:protein of unknown function [Methanoculleus bourgensis]